MVVSFNDNRHAISLFEQPSISNDRTLRTWGDSASTSAQSEASSACLAWRLGFSCGISTSHSTDWNREISLSLISIDLCTPDLKQRHAPTERTDRRAAMRLHVARCLAWANHCCIARYTCSLDLPPRRTRCDTPQSAGEAKPCKEGGVNHNGAPWQENEQQAACQHSSRICRRKSMLPRTYVTPTLHM